MDQACIGLAFWIQCSVDEPVLQALSEHSTTCLSSRMSSQLRFLEDCSQKQQFEDLGKARTAIVMAIDEEQGLVSVMEMATFHKPIEKVDQHTQHYAIAVDDTPFWPPGDTSKVRIDPAWPKTPCYALAKLVEVSQDRVCKQYRDKEKRSSVYKARNLLDIQSIIEERDNAVRFLSESTMAARSLDWDVRRRLRSRETLIRPGQRARNKRTRAKRRQNERTRVCASNACSTSSLRPTHSEVLPCSRMDALRDRIHRLV